MPDLAKPMVFFVLYASHTYAYLIGCFNSMGQKAWDDLRATVAWWPGRPGRPRKHDTTWDGIDKVDFYTSDMTEAIV